jgi:hypothetical protein
LASLDYPDFDKNLLSSKTLNLRIESEKEAYENAKKIFTFSKFLFNILINKYNCEKDKVVCVYWALTHGDQHHIILEKIIEIGIFYL